MSAHHDIPNASRDSLISAEENRKMFDAIARRYDLMNQLLSMGLDRYWRMRAVQALPLQPGCRILDIGSGTGDIALEVLKQQPTASVTGVDPSLRMLDIAQKKIVRRGLENAIRFEQSDATALSFPDDFFDGVITAFCIRNVEDHMQALAGMYRVLKPGGRAVILELTKPENFLLRQAQKIYNRLIVPLVGRLLSRGEAYRYLVKSIEDFPEVRVITDKVRRSRFKKVNKISLSGGITTIIIGEK